MAAAKHKAIKVYDLHVELEHIEPVIWRRLLVPARITLPKLHDLLQLAMGWTDSHLHCFHIGERTFGMAGADLEELGMLDERRALSRASSATHYESSSTSTTSVTAGAIE